MKRGLLSLTVVLLQLAVPQEAGCAPPDKVAHSPVPALEQPQKEPVGTESTPLVPIALSPLQLLPTGIPGQQDRTSSTPAQDAGHADYGSEHLALWNSPEMREARTVVKEFCRRAAPTSPEEGKRFLEQLSRLPPEQMENWLARFQSRRQNVSHGHEVGQLARLLNVGRSLDNLQAKRKAVQNVAELRRQAGAAREPSPSSERLEQGYAWVPIDAAGISRLRYNPLEPSADPSSPRGYRRRVAAAMSLPGDLPRSDPRNYIRGEAGVDFGEWANVRGAVPPALAAPVTAVPAVPAN